MEKKEKLNLPPSLESQIHNLVSQAVESAISQIQTKQHKEWMNLREAAAYAGVCYNTFMRYREQGLRIFEDENIKRVSKAEIDRFLNSGSF